MQHSFIAKNPSVLIFLAALALFTLIVSVLSEGLGTGIISTSFIKTLGKTLCLCLIAVAMDLIWGFAGILSLGHFAFFGLGGYMIGMWLMYERTRLIVVESLSQSEIPPTEAEVIDAIGNQIFGVVGSSEFPLIWAFADSLFLQLLLVLLVPGLLALIFGWLAFRSRVTGVYLSILTQAMTLALALYCSRTTAACAATTASPGFRTCPGWMRRRMSSRSGFSGPRRLRSGLVMFWRPGLSAASSDRSSAASATTRRGCVSSGIRSRPTSW